MAFAIVAVPSSASAAGASGITGTVTGPGGVPLSGIEVAIFGDVGGGQFGYLMSTGTNSSGSYAVPLSPGNYKVAFKSPDSAPHEYVTEFYDDAATLAAAKVVPVISEQVTPNVNAELTPGGRITGHVEDAAGTPIQDAYVDVYRLVGGTWTWDETLGGITDESGDYDVALDAGTYRLGFDAYGYIPEFYDDAQTVDTGTSITVATGSVAADKDAVLDSGASISGTVTLPEGTDPDSFDGVITAVDPASNDIEGLALLDPDHGSGSTYPYTMSGLSAGTYRVEFAHLDGWATVEAEFYNDHPESAGPASANAVTLSDHQQKTGIDATLRVGGTISGTLVDGEGNPVADCEVAAYGPNSARAQRYATTDTDGTFVIGGLTGADYGLVVGSPWDPEGTCPEVEWYTNTSGDLSESPAGAISVSATPGADTALPATLVYQGTLPTVANTGAPTVPSGAPQVGTEVVADPGTWNPSGATFSYQWKADGAAIPAATSKSYTPSQAVAGKKLSVTVTASSSGYNSASATSNETGPVIGTSASAVVQNLAKPSVSGLTRVGMELTTKPGAWTDGATTSIVWLRDGKEIVVEVQLAPVGCVDDLGARISVWVTATKSGSQPGTAFSAPTTPVQLGIITVTGVPRLLGKLKVGKVLRALPPSSSPTATSVRYRWLRNGVAIKGAAAKQSAYRLTKADRGKYISVRITVVREGYASVKSVAKRAGKVR